MQDRAEAPDGVALRRTKREYACCSRCKFHGDTIYFNRNSDGRLSVDCGFCELPAVHVAYGETRERRITDASPELGPIVGRTLARQLDNMPALQQFIAEHKATATVVVYERGSIAFEVHCTSFVDD